MIDRHGPSWNRHRRGTSRNNRAARRPALDALEARQLLATSPIGIDRGDFYRLGSESVPLYQATDRILIALEQGTGREILDGLTEPGGLLAGATFGSTSKSHLWTVDLAEPAAPDALPGLLGQVGDVPGIDWAAESFFMPGVGERLLATRDIVVGLAPGSIPEQVFSGSTYASYRPVRGTPDQFVVTTNLAPGRATVAFGNSLLEDPRIAFASADFLVESRLTAAPNDPLYTQQWHLSNPGQGGTLLGADVKARGAWDLGFTGQGVVIAIVDTGTQLDHPDLQPNLWVNTGEVAGNGIDDDGNGWVDDINGWDFLDNDNNPNPNSATESHGTSVAGVAAARGNNALGVAGAAYNAKIMALRLVGGATALSTEAEAVYYLSGRTLDGSGTWDSADIGNHSYGRYAAFTILQQAFNWSATQGREGKGVLNFAASGNDADIGLGASATYPSGYADVLCVGGSTDRDVRVSYSQYGPNLDFLASTGGFGVNGLLNIVTTDQTGASGYDPGDYTGLGITGFNGTSSASPLASGVGALLLEADPSLTFNQVRQTLRSTADRVGPIPYVNGRNVEYGYGRLNAVEAILKVATRIDLALPTNLVENQIYNDVAFGTLIFSSSTPASIQEFGALVDLGTGQAPVAANLVALSGSRYSIVVPVFSYPEGGTYRITITITRQGTPILTGSGNLTIGDLPLVASAVPLTLSEGLAFDGQVATFFDTDLDVLPSSRYTATINWGDGNSTTGTIQGSSGTGFLVSGKHTYAGGSFTMRVTIVGPGGGRVTATAPVKVTNSALTVASAPVQATEGSSFSGLVATFHDSDPRLLPSSYYTAVINWGDGPFASTEVGRPIPDLKDQARPLVSNLRFNVGDFSIADLDVNLTIRHDRPGDLTAVLIAPDGTRLTLFTGLARAGKDLVNTTFSDQAPRSIASGTPPYTGLFRPQESLSAFNGKQLNGSWKLELTDSASGFTGTLESWSIAPKAYGTVVPNPAGGFAVVGNHIYRVGSYDVSVQVLDSDLSDQSTATTATVANAAIVTSPGRVEVPEGTAFSGVLAYFQDSNPQADAATFTAVVDWGDGPYASANKNLPIPDFTDQSRTIVSTLAVDFGEATTADLNVLLNINHPRPSDLTAVLVAPDGTRVTLFSALPGTGADLIGTTFDDQAAVAIDLATAPYTGSFRPQESLAALVGRSLSGVWKLELTDTKGGEAGTLVDWAIDARSFGLVTADGGGQFVITGRHLYTRPSQSPDNLFGTFPITISLTEQKALDGPIVEALSAQVRNALRTSVSTTFTGVEGQAFRNIPVARFNDGNVAARASDYEVVVQWGNGATSPGTVRAVAGQPGLFEVLSSYAYPLAGNYNATVVVKDNGGFELSIPTSGTVVDAPFTGSGAIFVSKERTASGNALLGEFTDTNPLGTDVGQFRASIAWGDGTSSAGVIVAKAGAPGTYQVFGSHSYSKSGGFRATVTINSVQGGTTSFAAGAYVEDLILPLAGGLDPASDTGASNSDGITSNGALTFTGTADRLSTVTVYSQPTDGGPLTAIGTTTSDGNGNWRLTTNTLAQGFYQIYAQATDDAGRPGSELTPLFNSNAPLIVDTTGPQVLSTTYDARQRLFRVRFGEGQSGLNEAGLLNPAHYVLNGPNNRAFAASSVTQVAGDPSTVLVRFRSIPAGRAVLLINSAGVSDRAGNFLAKNNPNAVVVNLRPGEPYVAVFEIGGRAPVGPRRLGLRSARG